MTEQIDKNIFNRLTYVDHNVLDRMTRGEYLEFLDVFREHDLIAVYSSENLNEIKRSVGYENKFLDLLKTMESRYIFPEIEENRYTGIAGIQEADPYEVYQSYMDTADQISEYGYGLTGMLKKMYGGMAETSFSEILDKGLNEISDCMRAVDFALDGMEFAAGEKYKIVESLRMLSDILGDEYSKLGHMLDNELHENSVKEYDRAANSDPGILNNITGQNLLIQVWNKIIDVLPARDITLEEFFCIDGDKGLTDMEKVNAICHRLNHVGFYRDSNMDHEKRFKSSSGGMTHAGMASFCRYYFCKDKATVMKASAAYEYLGLSTQIVHIQNNG